METLLESSTSTDVYSEAAVSPEFERLRFGPSIERFMFLGDSLSDKNHLDNIFCKTYPALSSDNFVHWIAHFLSELEGRYNLVFGQEAGGDGVVHERDCLHFSRTYLQHSPRSIAEFMNPMWSPPGVDFLSIHEHDVKVIQHREHTLVIDWTCSARWLSLATAKDRGTRVINGFQIVGKKLNRVEQLIQAGYSHFVLINLPNVANTPFLHSILPEAKAGALKEDILQFNAYLEDEVRTFQANNQWLQHVNGSIRVFDAYAQYERIVNDASARNVTFHTPLLGKGGAFRSLQEDPAAMAQFMFVDESHPNAWVHQAYAAGFYEFFSVNFVFAHPPTNDMSSTQVSTTTVTSSPSDDGNPGGNHNSSSKNGHGKAGGGAPDGGSREPGTTHDSAQGGGPSQHALSDMEVELMLKMIGWNVSKHMVKEYLTLLLNQEKTPVDKRIRGHFDQVLAFYIESYRGGDTELDQWIEAALKLSSSDTKVDRIRRSLATDFPSVERHPGSAAVRATNLNLPSCELNGDVLLSEHQAKFNILETVPGPVNHFIGVMRDSPCTVVLKHGPEKEVYREVRKLTEEGEDHFVQVIDQVDVVGTAAQAVFLERELYTLDRIAYYGTHASPTRAPSPFTAAVLMKDIAGAVQFLHSRGIIHGNLQALQFVTVIPLRGGAPFLKAKFVDVPAKLGVKCICKEYLAPELLNASPVFTAASDTYSLGLLFYELLTLKRAWAEYKANYTQLILQVMDGKRPSIYPHFEDEKDEKCLRIIREIIGDVNSGCLAGSSSARPSVDDILLKLASISFEE